MLSKSNVRFRFSLVYFVDKSGPISTTVVLQIPPQELVFKCLTLTRFQVEKGTLRELRKVLNDMERYDAAALVDKFITTPKPRGML